MEKTVMQPELAERWRLRNEFGNSIPDSFDIEIVASLPDLSARDVEKRDGAPEWTGTLQLIEAASEVLRQKDREIEMLRTQFDQEKAVTREEFQALHAQLALTQAEVRNAHEDAARANKRAAEAEAWLLRVNEAVSTGFRSHIGRLAKPMLRE